MAIRLDFLDENKNTDKSTTFVYSDIALDFELSSDISNTPVNREDNKQDVKLNYDEQAILQSVANIFNTKPGEKILDPEFGLDLTQFLFLPITEDTAQQIIDRINTMLPVYEPRVDVADIAITMRPSSGEYIIDLALVIPTLNNKEQNVKGVLDLQGFRYQ